MKMIMTLINPVLQAVNWAVNGLQENAWPICLLLALGWFVKTQGRCRCLGAVWVLSGRCLGAVWALSGRCLGAVWALSVMETNEHAVASTQSCLCVPSHLSHLSNCTIE
jgi:hypothetical protein